MQQPQGMTLAATSISPKYYHNLDKNDYAMERLRDLKTMYTVSPIKNRFRPQLTTKRSEHSYYVQVQPTKTSKAIKYY